MFVKPLLLGPRGIVHSRLTMACYPGNSKLRSYIQTFLPEKITFTRNFSKPVEVCTFKGEKDRFNGVTVDLHKEPCDHSKFKSKLEDSLNNWLTEGKRCIWFRIKIEDASHIPILANKGFNFHHARDSYVMMYKWLPSDSGPNLPPSCHTNLGVGAMVFNNKNQLLAISEKHYEYPHWKLPGGYVERGEDIIQAAKREVKEETGVDAKFKSLVTFRHTHDMMYGNSDVYILVRMKAISDAIIISDREVNQCQWMDVEDYMSHPHVHKWNRFVVKRALEYRDRNLKLDLQKKTVAWAQNTREMTFLLVEDFND